MKTLIPKKLVLGSLMTVLLISSSGCESDFGMGVVTGASIGVAVGVVATVAVIGATQPVVAVPNSYGYAYMQGRHVPGNIVATSTPSPVPTPTSTPTPSPTPTPSAAPIVIFVPTPAESSASSPPIVATESNDACKDNCPEKVVTPPTTRDAFQQGIGH